MSNHSKEPRNSSNNVARKPLICYICDKIVKDYRLSTHLLFGSLQCKDCDHKFRRCREFESFRRSKDKIDSGSCAHQSLRWTRDPAKYLERKLLNDIERCKPGDHHPSSREVIKALLSYVSSLKPLESKSPWRRAIEKLKKLISQKKDISRTRDREGKQLQGSHHHGEEKGSENEVTYPCIKKNNTNREWEHYNGISQDMRGEHEHEHYLNLPYFKKDENETLYEFQSTNGFMEDEYMVPQYTEEVIIPQTEWEFDHQSLNDFQESDKSVEISVGNQYSDKISLTVEEVYSDQDSETSPMTLIIDNVNCSIDVAEEIPIAQEDSEASTEFCENSTHKPMNNLKNNNLEYLMTEDSKTNDTEKQCSEISEDDEEPLELSEWKTKNVQERLFNTTNISAKHKKIKSIKSETTHVNQVCTGNTRCKKGTKNSKFSSLEHSPLTKYEDSKINNVKNKNKKKFSRLDYGNRKSHREKRSSYKESELEKEDDKLLRCYRRNGGTFKGTKYNLRSRRSNSSEAFLQKLDAAEKKKLWEKLLPTARKLRKLNVKSNGVSLSTFIIPLDSEDNDDDFLIDVLLSQVLDIKQPESTTEFSSEEDDYSNCEEINILLNQVRRVVRQFTYSPDKSHLSAAVDSSNLSVNCCSKSDYVNPNDSVEREKPEKSKPKYLKHMTNGKDLEEKKTKTFYVSPPSDGNYYVINYPSQPLITECPMCYFRVFPSMFSLNLVTNLATTQCVGCMLTIYVVQEPGKNNSLPRIVFRRDDSSEEDQELAKPARFKNRTKKWQRKVSARSFFK